MHLEQVMVFVHSRKDTVKTAEYLAEAGTMILELCEFRSLVCVCSDRLNCAQWRSEATRCCLLLMIIHSKCVLFSQPEVIYLSVCVGRFILILIRDCVLWAGTTFGTRRWARRVTRI